MRIQFALPITRCLCVASLPNKKYGVIPSPIGALCRGRGICFLRNPPSILSLRPTGLFLRPRLLSKNPFCQIFPTRVTRINQPDLLFPTPPFNFFLPCNRIPHVDEYFKMHQPKGPVTRCNP